MSEVRREVAIGFYPGEPRELAEMLDKLLSEEAPERRIAPAAIIVPHAGYIYSGPTAAKAYAALRPEHYDSALMIGPSHRVPFEGAAVARQDAFQTPLGLLPADGTERSALLAAVPGLLLDNIAFDSEHSLEVQLPFVMRALGPLPLTLVQAGAPGPEAVGILAAVIRRYRRDRPSGLVIVSTDLSHYHRYEEAVRMDAQAVDRILALDETGLMEDVADGRAELCGLAGVLALMRVAGREGAKAELLDARNSGDTAGDRSGVVGYASLAVYLPAAEG